MIQYHKHAIVLVLSWWCCGGPVPGQGEEAPFLRLGALIGDPDELDDSSSEIMGILAWTEALDVLAERLIGLLQHGPTIMLMTRVTGVGRRNG
jgi:hypothetical protein